MKTLLLPTLLAALLAVPAFAQEPPKPGAEHQKLTARAGTWDAVIEMKGEDGKPITSKGVSELKVGPGGLWILDDFHADMMGSPFHGMGSTGFDPATGKYVGTWLDSWSTTVMVLSGGYDAAGKVLTMKGMAPGPDGKPTEHTLVTTEKDANTSTFEMYVPGPDGKPFQVMTITYTKRPAKSGGAK